MRRKASYITSGSNSSPNLFKFVTFFASLLGLGLGLVPEATANLFRESQRDEEEDATDRSREEAVVNDGDGCTDSCRNGFPFVLIHRQLWLLS